MQMRNVWFPLLHFYYIVRWARYKFRPVISGLMLSAINLGYRLEISYFLRVFLDRSKIF
jgi:hypothetical protein